MTKVLDKIIIKSIKCSCIIGILDFERDEKQDIFLTLELGGDFSKAAKTDQVEDALDYRFTEEIKSFIESSDFNLIEKLAEEIAQKCLAQNLVEKVKVIIEKPNALPFAQNTVLEIVR